MNVRKIKRICSVMGCSNMETYNITQTDEFVNPVIICENCLKQALKTIDELKTGRVPKRVPMPPPPLFGASPIEPIEKSKPETNEDKPTPINEEAEESKSTSKSKKKTTKSAGDSK